MNKTITIIELLNKRAEMLKGAKVTLPKTIKYENEILTLDEDYAYVSKETYCRLIDLIYNDLLNLNDEVEIIEQEEKINIQDIKKLNGLWLLEYKGQITDGYNADINTNFDRITAKINELLQAVKQLDIMKEDK